MELTVPEQTRLSELERVINDGLMTFIDVGASLLEIRNSRLYRHEYGTFEEYCRTKWGMSRIHAHRLIKAHEVVTALLPLGNNANPEADDLLPIGNIPTNERHARPLSKLPPEQQKEAWQRAVETAPNGKVTAKHVEKVVNEMKVRTDYPEELVRRGQAKPKMVTEAMRIATFAIVHLLKFYWLRNWISINLKIKLKNSAR